MRILGLEIGFAKKNVATTRTLVDMESDPPFFDIDNIAQLAEEIPGMVSGESGRILFSLCCFQVEEGDVLEIGSWQGRSSVFLGKAVEISNNGHLFAIDHFRGNKGKEHNYKLKGPGLPDAKSRYLHNMRKMDLQRHVTLFDQPTEKAISSLGARKIRFLFIDGDHSFEGVQKDIRLFSPLLIEGAIVVFDDFSNSFPGVVKAVELFIKERKPSRVFCYANQIAIKL